MPDYTYHIAQECSALGSAVQTKVPSSTGRGEYTVYVSPDGQKTHCTCQGYKFHGKCRHVRSVLEQRCDWHLDYSPEVQTLQQNVEMICPKCGGGTRLVRAAA